MPVKLLQALSQCIKNMMMEENLMPSVLKGYPRC